MTQNCKVGTNDDDTLPVKEYLLATYVLSTVKRLKNCERTYTVSKFPDVSERLVASLECDNVTL